MLDWVDRGEILRYRRPELTVDNDGILRESPLTRRQDSDRWRVYDEKQRVLAWMRGFKVLDYGSAQFWAAPVEPRQRTPKDPAVIHYRQTRRFTDDEARFWQSLRPETRKELGVMSDGSSSAFSTTAVLPADYRTIGVRIPEGGLTLNMAFVV
jgi:hypothetical protein